MGCNEDNLTALILTHTHFDHAENAASIKHKFQARIIVQRNEGELLRNGDSMLPAGTNFITRFLMKRFGEAIRPLCKYEGVSGDILVDEQLELQELGFEAKVIHTPGHSTGSMSVIVDNEIALVGDTMFGIFKGSVYPPFADDPQKMIESWKKLLDSGCSKYLPAHGNGRTRTTLEKSYAKYKFFHTSIRLL
jgi:glyoxylase-like metal-dependent hydrolase (beta-lactamase superfamily II)